MSTTYYLLAHGLIHVASKVELPTINIQQYLWLITSKYKNTYGHTHEEKTNEQQNKHIHTINSWRKSLLKL